MMTRTRGVVSGLCLLVLLGVVPAYAQIQITGQDLYDHSMPVRAGKLMGSTALDTNLTNPHIWGVYNQGTFSGWYFDNFGTHAWGGANRHVMEGPILQNNADPYAHWLMIPDALCSFPQTLTFQQCQGGRLVNREYSRSFLQPEYYNPINYAIGFIPGSPNVSDFGAGLIKGADDWTTGYGDSHDPYAYNGVTNCTIGVAGNPVQQGCFDSELPDVAVNAYTGTGIGHYQQVYVTEPWRGLSVAKIKKSISYVKAKYFNGVPAAYGGTDYFVYHVGFNSKSNSVFDGYYELNGFHIYGADHGAPVYTMNTYTGPSGNGNGGSTYCAQLIGTVMMGSDQNAQAAVEGGRAIVQSFARVINTEWVKHNTLGYGNFAPAGDCLAAQKYDIYSPTSTTPTMQPYTTLPNNSSPEAGLTGVTMTAPELPGGFIYNAVYPLATAMATVANPSTGETWADLVAQSNPAINTIGTMNNADTVSSTNPYKAWIDITYVYDNLPEDVGYVDSRTPSAVKTSILGVRNLAGTTFSSFLTSRGISTSNGVTVEKEAGYDDFHGGASGLELPASGADYVCTTNPLFVALQGLYTTDMCS